MKTENQQQKPEGNMFKFRWQTFLKSGKSYVGSINVLEESQLSCQARILFHIISSLSVKEGYCFANTKTLSAKLGLKDTMIKKYLRELENMEFIITKINPNSGNKRRIYVNFDTIEARYVEQSFTAKSSEESEDDGWIEVREHNKKGKQ